MAVEKKCSPLRRTFTGNGSRSARRLNVQDVLDLIVARQRETNERLRVELRTLVVDSSLLA